MKTYQKRVSKILVGVVVGFAMLLGNSYLMADQPTTFNQAVKRLTQLGSHQGDIHANLTIEGSPDQPVPGITLNLKKASRISQAYLLALVPLTDGILILPRFFNYHLSGTKHLTIFGKETPIRLKAQKKSSLTVICYLSSEPFPLDPSDFSTLPFVASSSLGELHKLISALEDTSAKSSFSSITKHLNATLEFWNRKGLPIKSQKPADIVGSQGVKPLPSHRRE